MKLSSKMENCGYSPMRKFNGYAAQAKARGIKIYHLNIGQPDVATPEVFFQALRDFSDPVVAYAPSDGVGVFVDSVRDYYARLGVTLEREHILPTNGGSEALQMTLTTLLEDGEEIIIPEPFYPNYHTPVALAGAKICPVPTVPEMGYFYADRKEIESRINENTRAILITNPGNPTGNVLSEESLKLMLDIAKEHNLYIVCDEVYREFTYTDGPLMSALQFEGYEDNVIIIDSVSKRFSACGARVGILISKNSAFMAQALKWCQCRLATATIEQVASAKLYTLDPNYFDAVREEYRRRRDTTVRCLKAIPGVKCETPQGAFYIMATLPVDDTDKFQMWLLNEFNNKGETVLFACGEPFYATPGKGRNEIRIAYTINCGDLERAIEILGIAIEEYNKL